MRGKWTKSHQAVIDAFIEYITETMIPEDDPEYWKRLVDEGQILSDKFGNNVFVNDLIIAHQNACERALNKKKQEKQERTE